MNLKKNNQKKDLVLKMIMELVELQSKAPKEVGKKLDYILKGFLHESLDFQNGIKYIDNILMNAKEEAEKIFWIMITKVIKKYFDESNKIK